MSTHVTCGAGMGDRSNSPSEKVRPIDVAFL